MQHQFIGVACRRRQSNEKGMAFIAAFSVYAILMVLTVTFLLMTDSDLNIAVNHRDTTKALYIGEAGIEYGIYKILRDWNWTGTSGSPVSLGDGEFEVAVADTLDGRKELTSTGISEQPLARGEVIESKRKIQVTLNPTAFRYAVFSNRRVVLSVRRGNARVWDPRPEYPAYIHSNTQVRIVQQFGTVDLNDAEITQGSPTVFIPDVDMEAYETEAKDTGFYINGDLTINFSYTGDVVAYATGNITIDSSGGNIVLNGPTLVAEGDIIITGANDITIIPDSEPLEETAYPSLVTKDGNIYSTTSFTGNFYAKLLIYTKNGYINLHNLMMNGSVMSGFSGLTGLTLRNTWWVNWDVEYDDSILTDNKPKYFTAPVDAASLLWKDTY